MNDVAKAVEIQSQTQEPQPGVPTEPVKPSVQESLVQRVSKFVEEKAPEVAAIKANDDGEPFDSSALDNIQSIEEAKEYLKRQRQSFDRGYAKKFEDLASQLKELKSVDTDGTWTADKIKQIMNRPDFIQAAQEVMGNQADYSSQLDDDSYLSEADRVKMAALEKQVQQLNELNTKTLRQQQHEQLKATYPNYDPKAIDEISYDILNGKRTIGLEDIHKSNDYESAIDRAYRMGRKDEREGINEKVNSSITPQTTRSVPPSGPIDPDKNESSLSFWNRIAQKNLANLRKAN